MLPHIEKRILGIVDFNKIVKHIPSVVKPVTKPKNYFCGCAVLLICATTILWLLIFAVIYQKMEQRSQEKYSN